LTLPLNSRPLSQDNVVQEDMSFVSWGKALQALVSAKSLTVSD